MKIIIAGAGEVGCHLAKMLGNEHHDIIILDNNADRIRHVSQLTDLIVIEGSSTSIETLQKANVHKTDLFIAVNPSEEQDMNITSAILAKRLGAKKVIARINTGEYLLPSNREIFTNLGVDYMFYPEKNAANEIIELLEQTGSTEYLSFGGGKLAMLVTRLTEGAPIIGKSIESLTNTSKGLNYHCIAIARDDETIIPEADDEFEYNDMVYTISNKKGVREVLSHTGKENINVKKLMILGGSPIATMVAKELENEMSIRLIDYDRDHCEMLADVLQKTLIINADGRNMDTLIGEDLQSMDAFVALTSRSETNILTCLMAKRLGVQKTIAEIENLDYIPLAESMGIDTVINKKLITAGRIFRFTMNTDVQAIKCLTGSDAEVLEFIAKPDSIITHKKLRDISFPKDAVIGGVISGGEPYIATGDSLIKAYDRVIVFALPTAINKIGKFFI